ncbi:hypothetical protein R1sor_024521 [Riccia sorocarpa]|uniref:Fungal lipase-type domain-containing protein n=1 Tax=Riccia sorocarpa TaxID=122646 RepID=A0ABD3GTZ7_9MARC
MNAPQLLRRSSLLLASRMSKEEEMTAQLQEPTEYVVTDPLSGTGHHGVFHYLLDLVRGKDRWRRGLSYSERGLSYPKRVDEIVDSDHTWRAQITVLCLKLLFLLYTPARWFGHLLEDTINLFLANGGIIKTYFRMLFPSKLVILDREHEDYVSLNAAIDPRVALYTRSPTDAFSGTRYGSKFTADALMMASKIAYENEKFIKKIVTKVWKMKFKGFFNCWNEFQHRYNTQAFVFTDRAKDARAIVVAFRGTEPFNTLDWSTDFDFSWLEIPGVGKLHFGFWEALGLGTRNSINTIEAMEKRARQKPFTACPILSRCGNCFLHHLHRARRNRANDMSGLSLDVQADGNKILAYGMITALVKDLMKENPKAKLFLTGHSLGGALANMYTALLFHFEEEKVTDNIAALYTFGQPRVGDEDYSNYLISKLRESRYWRTVYSIDMIPRVPFDNELFQFKHSGYCFYYNERFLQATLEEAPNANYFTLDPGTVIGHRISGLHDLIRSFVSGWYGPDFREGWMSIVARFLGLVSPGLAAHLPSNYISAIRLGPAILESKLH